MILVVEDNVMNQKVILTVLSMGSYDAEIAANGAEALELFADTKPDLILMDVSMPVMNGYDATRAIRDLEERISSHTPIIAITAHTAAADKELCFQSGMDDYVSKPILPQTLLQVIADWLDGTKNLPQVSRPAPRP